MFRGEAPSRRKKGERMSHAKESKIEKRVKESKREEKTKRRFGPMYREGGIWIKRELEIEG